MNNFIEGIDYKIEKQVLFINEGVEEIPDNAFESNGRFTTLVCPKSLKYIGKHAFNMCYIENLILKDGLEYIDEGAFSGNNIITLKIPDSVYYIGNSAFSENKNLSGVKLSNSLGVIQMRTFCGCINLEDIVIPESVKVIDKYAFYKCGIKKFIIPNSIQYTTNLSFGEDRNSYGCYSDFNNVFATVDDSGICVYNTTKKILKTADYHIDMFNKLVIREGVQIIPPLAFINNEIKEIVFPSTLRIISREAFANCKNLHSVKFPDSLIYIGVSAFKNCSRLNNIEFNNGLIAIDRNAFNGHRAESIDLPESLVYLEREAFKANPNFIDSSQNKFVNINHKNIKYIDFTDNNLSTVDVTDYPHDAYIANSKYNDRKRKANYIPLFDAISTSNTIGTTVEENRKRIANVSEIESQTIGKIIQTQIDNYLLNKEKYISLKSLTNVIESLILSGGNLNNINNEGSPLIITLLNNNLTELVQLLLMYGANINVCDTNGISMLMYSINNNDINMFNTLLKLNCDVNLRDINGNTALIYAIRNKNVDFVNMLIKNNAYINTTNSSNQSALDLARDTNCKEIINLLKCQDEENDPNVDDVQKDLEYIKSFIR